MTRTRLIMIFALATASPGVWADRNAELNQMLEDNAVAAAYARMCDEEPMAEELKANTMMLLAVSGLEPHNVQLGSAKFSQLVGQTFAATKNLKSVDCLARVTDARSRLAQTQHIIQATRR